MKRIGVCLVLALFVGCSTNGDLLSASEVQGEFESARSEVPLPDGYEFAEIQIPDVDASYERGFGDVQAETYAQCAWFDHWLESYESDDVQAMQESLGVLTTFRSGFKYRNADSSYQRGFEQVLESMTDSSPDLVSRELDINCPELNRL